MSFKSHLSSHISFAELERLRRPGMLFGAGLAAGIALFALWLLFTPSNASQSAAVQPSEVAAGEMQLATGRKGVLGDITGGMEQRRAGSATLDDADESLEEGAEGEALTDDGQSTLPEGEAIDEEQALAEGLLPREDGTAATLPLQLFYVEVERDENVSEIIEIQAESPEQALVIVRDFRGAPAILRGPSLQPLD